MLSNTAYSEQIDIKHNIFNCPSQLSFFPNFHVYAIQPTTYEQNAGCQSALTFDFRTQRFLASSSIRISLLPNLSGSFLYQLTNESPAYYTNGNE